MLRVFKFNKVNVNKLSDEFKFSLREGEWRTNEKNNFPS